MYDFRTITVPLPLGKVTTILNEVAAPAGTKIVRFTLDCESVLISLFVGSIGPGTLTVTVFTETDEGKDLEVISFPVISGPTANLLLKKAAVAMNRIRVEATSTASSVTYEIRAKGISSAEASVKILGANDWHVSQITVPTVATLLIPVALVDRSGLLLKNFNTSGILYIAESVPNTTSAIGWPLGPGESLALDLSAGESVYGIASSGTIDCRIAEAGT